jgi:SAM (Sterile alpha motif) domain-containing protein
MDIAAWLRSLGLEQYEPAFRENEIDWEVLPQLTSEDLKEVGIVVGHRRKLLMAAAVLRGGAASQLRVMFCDPVGSTALSARLEPVFPGKWWPRRRSRRAATAALATRCRASPFSASPAASPVGWAGVERHQRSVLPPAMRIGSTSRSESGNRTNPCAA